MSERQIFYLNDTHVRDALNWLADFTRQAKDRQWGTSEVVITAQPMRWNTEPKGDNLITTTSIYGVVQHLDREENDSVSEPGPPESPCTARLIHFKFLPVRETQLEMTVTLEHPAAREYRDDLMARMAQVYPEMQPQLRGSTTEGPGAQAPMQPLDSETASEVERIGFVLNTTFGLFRGWLSGHTENVGERHFPNSEGVLLYLYPPGMRSLGYEDGAEVFALTVGHLRTLPDGRREARAAHRHLPFVDKDGNETGVSEWLGAVWAVRFKVLPLAAERVEVTAECVEPVVLDYFKELLEAIGENYKEAREAIHSYLAPGEDTGDAARPAPAQYIFRRSGEE